MLHWFLVMTIINPNACISNLQTGCGTPTFDQERVAMPSQEKCEEIRSLLQKSSLKPKCWASASDAP